MEKNGISMVVDFAIFSARFLITTASCLLGIRTCSTIFIRRGIALSGFVIVIIGAEFGWRYGAGKRPEWYPDNLQPVINVGPGSPTGMTLGYQAKFPAKYQHATFILD